MSLLFILRVHHGNQYRMDRFAPNSVKRKPRSISKFSWLTLYRTRKRMIWDMNQMNHWDRNVHVEFQVDLHFGFSVHVISHTIQCGWADDLGFEQERWSPNGGQSSEKKHQSNTRMTSNYGLFRINASWSFSTDGYFKMLGDLANRIRMSDLRKQMRWLLK